MVEIQTPILNDTIQYHVDNVEVTSAPLFKFIKRTFDILASVLLLLLLAVPMAIIGIVIRLDSPGPAIFKQDRLGKNGAPFVIYKFRTMNLDAEKDGPVWAQENDVRCTRPGRIIRKSRIDELPQLINVIKGEMSIVGPRPEREFFYNKFAEYIDGFDQRLKVTPGITGLAQVNGGYMLPPEEKIVYDVEYIRNMSVWMDVKCILKTVGVVFSHEGAR